LVGNYGVPSDEKDEHGMPRWFESEKIHVKALVIADYSFETSHYESMRTLGDWLKSQGVPGIYGVDTRAVTKLIRNTGSAPGKVVVEGEPLPALAGLEDPNTRNLAAEVSRKEKKVYYPLPRSAGATVESVPASQWDTATQRSDDNPVHILAVDCGMKFNIIRYFINTLRVKLTVVPWDYDFTNDEFDGLFLSNGPGDPTQCGKTIEHIRTVMQRNPPVPIFGICLGNQLLALAAGAKTYKMKFGNRGMNQPVIDLRTTRCYITPQNHGFAVDTSTLIDGWMPLMMNANDGSNEGIIHRSRPWFSVQFHPEAAGGPTDTAFLFKYFLRCISDPTSMPVTTMP